MFDSFIAALKRRGVSADAVQSIMAQHGGVRSVAARADIAVSGERSGNVQVLLEGWACKYRLMSDGRRQIVTFVLAGDICDLDEVLGSGTDFGVTALSDCKVTSVPVVWLCEARVSRPDVRELLWTLVCREHATMSEQIVALGRRTSRQRIAYLLCDLLGRLRDLGLAVDGRFRSPLTQTDIGDALGLSTVHVNRTLQALREDGLIEMRGRSLRVPNEGALRRAADLEPITELMPSA